MYRSTETLADLLHTQKCKEKTKWQYQLDHLQRDSQNCQPQGFPVLPGIKPVEQKNVHQLWMRAAGRNGL